MFVALSLTGGWGFDVALPFGEKTVDVRFSSDGFAPALLVYGAGILGLVLGIGGAVWEFVRHQAAEKRRARKKIIVVEARGLRDFGGVSLLQSLPEGFEGQRESLLLDIRQGVKDGVIVDPAAAIDAVNTLPIDISRRERGFDRGDISIVYGGMTPVPITFLTGVLLDDEATICVFDWDRHEGAWRPVAGSDDGDRFIRTGFEDIGGSKTDVVLAVSVSYQVNLAGVAKKYPDLPLVQLSLPSGGPDCHWSLDKQRGLGRQFLDTVIGLERLGVRRIHLFLAAQNSVVFRFGQLYDKRNLPQIVVYQYQQESDPPLPWGISMPVAGQDTARIVAA
jgi:hypothetical protein